MEVSSTTEVRPGAEPSFAGALQGLWLLTWKRRLAWRQLPALVATVVAIPALGALAGFGRAENEARFFQWVVVFYFQVALPLYCLAVLGDVVRSELQANTLVFLTTRPVARARLFAVKYLCELAWVQLLAMATALLLAGTGLVLGLRESLSVAGVLLGTQLLAILAYGSLSALLGMLHRRFLVVGAIYGMVVEVGVGQIPTNINNLSINRHVRTLLANIPSFRDAYNWSPEETWVSLLILMVAAVVLAALAASLFQWREYHYNEEMSR